VAIDTAADLSEAKGDTFEGKEDICRDPASVSDDPCACTVSATIPFHPTQCNSSQDVRL